jgi:dTDP-4-dehydrorhamnose reductase
MVYHSQMKEFQGFGDLNSGPVLVIGASGLLGSRIFDIFSDQTETYGTYFQSAPLNNEHLIKLDATELEDLRLLIENLKPSRIINCAGFTDVEGCEERPEASWKLNAEIPIMLSRLAKEFSAQFIQISTDHFYTKESIPRNETILVTTLNYYGFSKIAAENAILHTNTQALILRTNFFGFSKKIDKSILNFAISAFETNAFINGFDDVFFTPVGMTEIAKFLLSESSTSVTGLLNFASNASISKYDFLKLVGEAMGNSGERVNKASILDSGLTVRRPKYMSLDPGRLNIELGYILPSLPKMLENEFEYRL